MMHACMRDEKKLTPMRMNFLTLENPLFFFFFFAVAPLESSDSLTF